MTVVTERLYRNHVIHINPAIYPAGATGEAEVSITGPSGNLWWEAEATGTEAGMFRRAEGEIDTVLRVTDDTEQEDPDGDYARSWRLRNGWKQ